MEEFGRVLVGSINEQVFMTAKEKVGKDINANKRVRRECSGRGPPVLQYTNGSG